MGYSCSAAAHDKLAETLCKAMGKPFEKYNFPGNTWDIDGRQYFYERGREQEDGHITGAVFKFLPDGIHCQKIGSVHISAMGNIKTWAGMPKKHWK